MSGEFSWRNGDPIGLIPAAPRENEPREMKLRKSRMVDLSTDPAFFSLLTDSYVRLVGIPLVPPGKDAHWLYHEAPFVVVAHDTDRDPKFIYANKAAQACFEYAYEEFLALPSRLSAEPTDWVARQTLLDKVSRDGFLSGYRGLRVAKFDDGVVWELIDRKGMRHGQAATFRSWRNL